ncbi:uncharacterized protein LOC124269353 [Haliotis rubra]|uniref:uncharacterized protein LOC124269353 n=1 Tax=Haliotis rubra TaxID=36100 RepID=UPI001EE54B5E|nr:uncharacterized protein LOC124269353 [Haliotis rubra]
MTVHLFGGVWSPSCASFAVRRTAEDHRAHFNPETIRTILENLYVDDCLKSVASVSKAINLVKELCELLQRGGFKLTKWIINSREVLDSIHAERRAKEVKDVDLGSNVLPQERALGVSWNTESDKFGYLFMPKNKPTTRRGILSVISSIYDPFGFICPVTLQAKKIFQRECRLKKGWDDLLEKCHEEKWIEWIQKLSRIEQLTITRCVSPFDSDDLLKYDLHHFSDASMEGYGAVSYLRIVNSDGRIHCAILMGKARLAPMKQITIPRLELSAAVISVKLDQLLRQELRLKISSSTFWSDSMVVLHYIKSDSHRFHTFVANRIAVIHEGSTADDWRYVESKLNPGDDASRGLNADEMISQERWMKGPDFLWLDESAWPTIPEAFELPERDLELKRPKVYFVQGDVKHGCTNRLLERYSSWYKLKRAVAWILRLKQCLLIRYRNMKSDQRVSKNPLTVEEIRTAEYEVVKFLQRCHFSDEINDLTGGHPVKKTSSIYRLEPVINSHGIMFAGGRLKYAEIPEQAKHQMILPKAHHVARLIGHHYDELLGHSGREHVLSQMRQRFWIISARATINEILRNCTLQACTRSEEYPKNG